MLEKLFARLRSWRQGDVVPLPGTSDGRSVLSTSAPPVASLRWPGR